MSRFRRRYCSLSTIKLGSNESLELFVDALTPDLRRAILTPGTWLYIIDCERDRHLYVGISRVLADRIEQHLSGHGSQFTQRYGVKAIRPVERFDDTLTALRAETALAREMQNAGYICAGGGYNTGW